MSWLGKKIKSYGKSKISELKDDYAFRKQEKAIFKQSERKGKLVRAAKEGYKSGRTKPHSKLVRAASIIRTDGPDPFGLFEGSRQPQKRKRSKHRRPKKVVYY
jgi:hypothetical protein